MVDAISRRTGWEAAKCRRILHSATTEEYLAAGGETPIEGERIDPIEGDSTYAAVLLRATLEAEVEADRWVCEGTEGYCHEFWQQKQRILWKRYGVRWQSPAELNPQTEFD